MRARANPRTPFLHRRLQSEPLQMTHAVWRQEHAGSDLAERRRLLVERHRKAMTHQRMRGEQAADPAANNHRLKMRLRHLVFHCEPAEADRRRIFTRAKAIWPF